MYLFSVAVALVQRVKPPQTDLVVGVVLAEKF
jgi:hypothetical protein